VTWNCRRPPGRNCGAPFSVFLARVEKKPPVGGVPPSRSEAPAMADTVRWPQATRCDPPEAGWTARPSSRRFAASRRAAVRDCGCSGRACGEPVEDRRSRAKRDTEEPRLVGATRRLRRIVGARAPGILHETCRACPAGLMRGRRGRRQGRGLERGCSAAAVPAGVRGTARTCSVSLR